MNKKRFLRLVSLMLILAMVLPVAGAAADVIYSNGVVWRHKEGWTNYYQTTLGKTNATFSDGKYYFKEAHPLGGSVEEVYVYASDVQVAATPEPTPTPTPTLRPGTTPTPPPPSLEGNADAEYTGTVRTYKVTGASFWLYDGVGGKAVESATAGTTLTLTEVWEEVEDEKKFTGWYSTWYKSKKYFVPASALQVKVDSEASPSAPPLYSQGKTVSVHIKGGEGATGVALFADRELKTETTLTLSPDKWYNVTYVTSDVLEYKVGGVGYYFRFSTNKAVIETVSDATIGGTDVSYVTELTARNVMENDEVKSRPRVFADMSTDSEAMYVNDGDVLFASLASKDWYQVIYRGKTWYVRANDVGEGKTFVKGNQTAVSDAIVGNTKLVTIGSNGAQLYTEPDTKKELAGQTLSPGTSIRAAVYNNAWYVYSIYAGDKPANRYFQAKDVADANAAEDVNSLRVYLNSDTKLYVSPSTNSNPSLALDASGYYVVKSHNYDWYSIVYGGRTYYIQKDADRENAWYLTVPAGKTLQTYNVDDEKAGSLQAGKYKILQYTGVKEDIYGVYRINQTDSYIKESDVKKLFDNTLPEKESLEQQFSGTTSGKTYSIVIAEGGATVYQNALLTNSIGTLGAGTIVQAVQYTPALYKVDNGYISVGDVAAVVGGDDYTEGESGSTPGGSVDDIHNGSTDTEFTGEVVSYTVPAGGLWLYKASGTGKVPADISLNQGTKISLTGVDENWYRVYYNGGIYYVNKADLKRDENNANKPGVFSIVVSRQTVVYDAMDTTKGKTVGTIAANKRVNVKVAKVENKATTWYAYLDEMGTKTIGYFPAKVGEDATVELGSELDALVSIGANTNFVYVITLKNNVTLYSEPDNNSVRTTLRADESKPVQLLAAIHNSEWYKVDYNGSAYYLLRSAIKSTDIIEQVTTGNGAASSILKVTIGPNGATLYTYPSIPSEKDKEDEYVYKVGDQAVTLPAGTIISASVYSGSWYTCVYNGQTRYFQNNVVVNSNTAGTMTSYRFTITAGAIQLYSWPSGANSLGSKYRLTKDTGNGGTHVARKTNAGWWEISFDGKTCYFKDADLQKVLENAEDKGDYIGTTTVGKTYKVTIKQGDGALVYNNVLLAGEPIQTLKAGYQISAVKRLNSKGAYAYEVQIGGTVGYIDANDIGSINGSDEINESINAEQPNNSDVAVGTTVTVSLPAGTKVYEFAMVSERYEYVLPTALNNISAVKRYSAWYEMTYNGTKYYFESRLVEKGASSGGTSGGTTGGSTNIETGTTVTAFTLPAGTKIYPFASTDFGTPVTLSEAWTGKLTKAYSQWYRLTYTDGSDYYVMTSLVEGAGGGSLNVDGSNSLPIGTARKFTIPAGTQVYYFAAVNYGSFPLTAKLETTVTKAYADWYSFLYEGQKVYIQAKVVEGNSASTGGSGSNNGLGLDVSIGDKTPFTFKNATKAYASKSTSSFSIMLQAGATYTLVREDPDWYRVQTGSNEYYYVSADSVTTETGSTDGSAQQPSNPTTDGTGIITQMLLVSPATGSVNLRKQATTGSTVLDRVPKGAQVRNLGYTKDGNGQLWYKVTYNGRTGYMLGTYVKAVGTGGSTDGGTVIDPSQDIGRTLTVNTENVNVRSGAGMTFSVLGKIAKGVSITPTEVKQDNEGQYWYRFQYTASAYGYIRGDYLTGSAVNNTVQSGNVAIKSGGTNLRSGAGTMFGVRAKLERDTIVTVLGTGTDTDGELWYRVTVNGLSGYVRHDLVRPLTSSESDGLISDVVGTYVELRYGSKGDAVRSLQVQLISIGYLAAGEADGSYGPKTMAAVQAFQKANGLTPNGIATPATQAKLFNTPPTSSGSTTSLDWFSTGYDLINKYPNISVYDINTGVSWNAKYINGTKHADVVPASQADASKLVAYKITGDYHRRPVIVTINGSKYAGSMYAVGHGNTNYVSWFSGVMCIHFTGSMTHGSQVVDKDHQQAIQDALNSGL